MLCRPLAVQCIYCSRIYFSWAFRRCWVTTNRTGVDIYTIECPLLFHLWMDQLSSFVLSIHDQPTVMSSRYVNLCTMSSRCFQPRQESATLSSATHNHAAQLQHPECMPPLPPSRPAVAPARARTSSSLNHLGERHQHGQQLPQSVHHVAQSATFCRTASSGLYSCARRLVPATSSVQLSSSVAPNRTMASWCPDRCAIMRAQQSHLGVWPAGGRQSVHHHGPPHGRAPVTGPARAIRSLGHLSRPLFEPLSGWAMLLFMQ
jgi:hypothetical protein